MIIDDVTRALECCKDGRCDICGRQGQFADERMCRFDLLEHAYHVIGCQKKEIDKLAADVDALEKGVMRGEERKRALFEQQAYTAELQAEIERLKQTPKCIYAYDGETMEYCVEGPCSVEKTVEKIQTEAIKEFAERYKEEIKKEYEGIPYHDLYVEAINRLVKEITEDTP